MDRKKEKTKVSADEIKRYYIDVGKFLEQIRISKKLTSPQVAEALGTNKQTIRQFEKGEVRIHAFYLEKFMDFYGLNFEDISPNKRKKIAASEEIDDEEIVYYKSLIVRLSDIIRKQNQNLRQLCQDYAKLAKTFSTKAAEKANSSSMLQKDFDSSLKLVEETDKLINKNES